MANGAAHEQLVVRAAGRQLVETREVVVRIRHVRIELERALVRRDRFRVATLILDDNSEIEPVERDAVAEADRDAIVRLRERVLACIVVQAAEVVVRIREVWTTRDRALVGRAGGGRIHGFEGNAPLVMVYGRRGATERQAEPESPAAER